ncbi:MAG: hypothetical protein OEX07_08935 [Gammaproteobacteria bacterium]|nr:hypothetical protein [Gammaproteobacteria bacterium]
MSAASFINKLEESLTELVCLNIVTAVGPVSCAKNGNDITVKAPDGIKCISSTINVLDGDIDTLIHDDFTSEKLKAVLDFHLEREKKGHEIITGNIKALVQLLELAKSFAPKD